MKFHGGDLISSVSRPSGPYRALFSKTHSSISGQPYRFPNCSQEQKSCPTQRLFCVENLGFLSVSCVNWKTVCFLCEHYSPDIMKTHTLSSFKFQPIDIFCLFCSSSLLYFNFSIPFQTNIPMLILHKPALFPQPYGHPLLFIKFMVYFLPSKCNNTGQKDFSVSSTAVFQSMEGLLESDWHLINISEIN